jgi:hypothetical protein
MVEYPARADPMAGAGKGRHAEVGLHLIGSQTNSIVVPRFADKLGASVPTHENTREPRNIPRTRAEGGRREGKVQCATRAGRMGE